MFVELTEVYEDVTHANRAEGTKRFYTRDVVLNTKYISFMKEDNYISQMTGGVGLPDDLKKGQRFTRVSISRGNTGQDIIVLGDLKTTNEVINKASKRSLLKD